MSAHNNSPENTYQHDHPCALAMCVLVLAGSRFYYFLTFIYSLLVVSVISVTFTNAQVLFPENKTKITRRGISYNLGR